MIHGLSLGDDQSPQDSLVSFESLRLRAKYQRTHGRPSSKRSFRAARPREFVNHPITIRKPYISSPMRSRQPNSAIAIGSQKQTSVRLCDEV
jgi:hypothetical protein